MPCRVSTNPSSLGTRLRTRTLPLPYGCIAHWDARMRLLCLVDCEQLRLLFDTRRLVEMARATANESLPPKQCHPRLLLPSSLAFEWRRWRRDINRIPSWCLWLARYTCEGMSCQSEGTMKTILCCWDLDCHLDIWSFRQISRHFLSRVVHLLIWKGPQCDSASVYWAHA